MLIPRLPRLLLAEIEPCTSAVFLPFIYDRSELSCLIQRNTGMKEQIAVIAHIHAAALIQIVHMALQRLALQEIGAQICNDVLLLLRELIAVRPIINCGEIGTLKLHAATIAERNIGGAVIDLVKKQAVPHLKVRITLNERSLEFEHHHRNGTLRRLDGVLIRVDARGKGRERTQADPVAALEDIRIPIAQ